MDFFIFEYILKGVLFYMKERFLIWRFDLNFIYKIASNQFLEVLSQ